MKLDIYSHNFTVNFSDVDENNQITNKGMLRLMQEIAGIHCGLLGYGVNDTPKTGLAWLILNWKLQMFFRPKTNTSLIARTWTRSQSPLFSYRDFEVYDDKNNLVAIASSKWILFNVNKKCISKITQDIKEKYICVDKYAFKDSYNEKLKEPENSRFIMNYLIQRRDIDTNHHVNNLYYLDYAYEALPFEVFENCKFSNVEIMYKHEAKLGDTISLFYADTPKNEHIVTIKNSEDNKLNAIIKLY
ncbi:MAG: thioesterase [Clostridia bacterium]|nr:thioesterase [Clostridia bacterium]